MEMKFYKFSQNNSGGRFYLDDKTGIGVYMFIEATNANMANYLAIELGLYFNGVSDGSDCDCCGDRWYHADESDAFSFDEAVKYVKKYSDLGYVNLKTTYFHFMNNKNFMNGDYAVTFIKE